MNGGVVPRVHWTGRVVLGVLLLGSACGTIVPASGHADDTTWLHGTWHGDRQGYPVTWRFTPDGRMRLEDRGAAWSVKNDTLVVDLDPLGKSKIAEHAVYRFLTSSVQRDRRLLFLRGFDLGSDGLLLAREEEHAEDLDSRDGGDTGKAGDANAPATKAPRRAP